LACGDRNANHDRNANRRHANAHRIAFTDWESFIAFARRVANRFTQSKTHSQESEG